MSTCRGCGAPISFVLTDRGRRMPIDAKPRADGNVVLMPHPTQHGEQLVAFFDPERHAGMKRWQSHFAVCPQAPQFRRGKP